MVNILEDAINAFNGLNNNNYRDIRRGMFLAETYSKLAKDRTKGYTDLPKDQDERMSHEPKTVTAGLIGDIRDDVENNIRPQIHEFPYEGKTPYEDMDKAEKNSNTTWDREDI